MPVRKLIIIVLIAAVIGVLMGAMERLFGLDLGFFPFVIPIFFVAVSFGGTIAASKSKNRDGKIDLDERPAAKSKHKVNL